MINSQHEIRPGRPRKGKEMVEYQFVKLEIIELLNEEVSDQEIAARLGLSRNGFYQLKKRILHEAIAPEMAQNVAAREYMRLTRQQTQLIKYMDSCYALGLAPDAPYITAFVNISKRVCELVGADAQTVSAIEIVDHGQATVIRESQLQLSKDLAMFYDISRRMVDAGIGSGLTDEEQSRELANLRNELGIGDDVALVEAEIVDDPIIARLGVDADGMVELAPDVQSSEDDTDDTDDTADDIELIDLDEYSEHDDDPVELFGIDRATKAQQRDARMDVASGNGDKETPGRWVAGKFISFWHDLGDPTPDAYEDIDDMNNAGENWSMPCE